jgi:hypothetical protein
MRLTRVAAFAAATALLAACAETPTQSRTGSLYDLSKVRFTRVTSPAHPASGVKAPAEPRFICNPNLEECPTPLPLADFDYGSFTDQSTSGNTKTVSLTAWSDQYAHIDDMELTAHFKSVGAQGPSGCGATPAQFDQDYTSGFGTWWVDHWTIYLGYTANYASSSSYVWQVSGDHTFYASSGYGATRYSDVGTFYSSASVCY